MPASLAELIEDSRSNWGPGPLPSGDGFHRKVRKRIRRRNARNAGFVALALGALLVLTLRQPAAPEESTSAPIAEAVAEDPSVVSPIHEAPTHAVIAEGGLPDLSGTPTLEPWFDRALRDDFEVTALPMEYGALGALYLGTEL